MSLDQAQLGDTIRLLRRNLGMTQQDLGDKIGVTNAAIGQFENGKTAPGLTTVAALANALEVGVGVLFGDPLAVAEHTVAHVRAEVRALGYDIALIPREDRGEFVADYKREDRGEFVADYKLLRSEGYTRRQIAERLGMHYDAVTRAYGRAVRAGDLTPDRRTA